MAELAIINGYDIRDRKLADATSATTVQSSDSVILKTTSGAYTNVLKKDFTEAIRNVLGEILHDDQDKGTSIDKVAAFGTDNNFGSISTANLASVLGGFGNIRLVPPHPDLGRGLDELGVIKWITSTYTNNFHNIFIGPWNSPSTHGTYILEINATTDRNSENIPRYASGIFMRLSIMYYFTIYDYIFEEKLVI